MVAGEEAPEGGERAKVNGMWFASRRHRRLADDELAIEIGLHNEVDVGLRIR